MLFFKKRKKTIVAEQDAIKNDVVTSKLDIKELKNAIEGANINILLGAGFTANIYKPLNNIEDMLTYVERIDNQNLKDVIIWEFFKKTILPMSSTKIQDMQLQVEFFKTIRELLTRRGNPVVNKQANIFTTNYDVVPELTVEHLNFDYNDGFKGKINPKFSTANYGNILIKNLVSSNNKAEIESINLYKMHGSLTWRKCENSSTDFNYDFINIINQINEEYKDKFQDNEFDTIKHLIEKKDNQALLNISTNGQGLFNKLTNIFNMVWPTKQKFHNTVLNLNYYELLRIFSNELEKNQSLLLVFGFSFNDEHILEIVTRSLANPTLLVYIFCFTEDEANKIYKKFENCENFNNIKFIYDDQSNFDLERLNKELDKIYS